MAAGEEDAAEVVKGVNTVTGAFEDLDSVVSSSQGPLDFHISSCFGYRSGVSGWSRRSAWCSHSRRRSKWRATA